MEEGLPAEIFPGEWNKAVESLWIAHNTATTSPLGTVANITLTLHPLETGCLQLLSIPPAAPNMWLFGVTIEGESNNQFSR
jgi:hypothetical protein